jgi:Domain of unknown function (DUF4389)
MDMWFAGPRPQRRLTVAFRLILVIPQLVVLFFVYIGLFFVVLIGWFAALFMGRLPQWAHSFVSDVLRWTARVDGYVFLLTDRYPPFTFDDLEYPLRPFFPSPGRLNRWAVLFRLILAFPAGVFAQIVRYGLTFPLLVVVWFIVLIRGAMPPQFYCAYAALLRYDIRFATYFYLLTSEWPWGMLGDRGVTAPPFPAQPTPGGTPPSSLPPSMPPSMPPSSPQPYAYPPAAEAGPADAVPAPQEPTGPAPAMPPPMPPAMPPTAPPALPPPMPPPSVGERAPSFGGERLPAWGTLVLTGAARGWMIFAIVWGSVLLVGQSAIQNAGHHHANNGAVVTSHAAARGDALRV